MSDVAVVCSNLQQRSKYRSANPTEELDAADLALVQEALAPDLELQSWGHTLPPQWAPISTQPISNHGRPPWIRELLASPGAPKYSTRYPNHLAACDSNACRATRILLHMQILSFISTFSSPVPALTTLQSHSLDVVITLTSEIACTVPFALDISPDGRSDPVTPAEIPGLCAYRIIWPVFTGLMCLQNDLVKARDFAQTALWFRTILRFLRDTMGIAKVDVFLKR